MLCPSSPPRARTVHLRVQIKLRKHQLQSLPADLRMEQSARFRQSAAQIHVAIVVPRDYSSLLLRAAYDTTDTPRLATHGNLYATADSHYAPSPRLVALTAPHRSSSRLRTDTCSRSSCRPNARARRPSGSPSPTSGCFSHAAVLVRPLPVRSALHAHARLESGKEDCG